MLEKQKSKKRVQSYFRHNPNHSNKVLRMIYNIASFETIDVATELDALLLECRYIQQYHPLYNRQMNFYQNYLYVGIVGHEILLSTEYQPNFWDHSANTNICRISSSA